MTMAQPGAPDLAAGAAIPPLQPTALDATLRDWTERAASEAPGAPALLGPEGSVSYADLHQRVLALAQAFSARGIGAGDIVAAQLPNGLAFVLTYMAAGYLGATLQTIHMPYRAAEIEPLLAHSGAKAVVCMAQLKDFSPAECALDLSRRHGTPKHVFAVGEGVPSGAAAFPEAEAAPSGALARRPQPDDRFLLLYTSGTTSAPKGVPIAYRQFLPNAARSAHELGIDRSSVLLSVAPFTHLYGLFSLHLALSRGAATAILPAFTPTALVEALDRYRPTGLFVAPAHMAACLQQGLLSSERLASLRFVLISGSACPPELAQAVQALMANGEVLQLWGMSELQAGAFTRPGDASSVRFETTGRASPGTKLRVVADDATLPAGREGELQVRGASVFQGYLGNPAATAGAFTPDGWFRTGDLAILDGGGNVRITGRSKDVINRGGVKFNPADVEALIERHPAITACAIVPMPDAVLGERACCFVVLKAGARDLQLADICQWLAAHDIAKLKWPERLAVIDEMPMTPTRKIMKGELARRAAGA